MVNSFHHNVSAPRARSFQAHSLFYSEALANRRWSRSPSSSSSAAKAIKRCRTSGVACFKSCLFLSLDWCPRLRTTVGSVCCAD